LGKTADIADFQHDGHGQNKADAGYRHQLLKCLTELYFIFNRFFQL